MNASSRIAEMHDCNLLTTGDEVRWLGQLQLPEQRRPASYQVVAHADGYVAYPARCPHEGTDLTQATIDARGRLVCPTHGLCLRPESICSQVFRAWRTQRGFLVDLSTSGQPMADQQEVEELRLEVSNLRQANASLEQELITNAELMDVLIEESETQKETLQRHSHSLKALNNYVERAIGTMSELFVLLDSNGLIAKINHAVERDLGFTAAALLGTPLEDLLTGDDRARLTGSSPGPASDSGPLLLNAIRAGGGRYAAEHYFVPADGTDTAAVPYLLRGSLMHGPSGKLEGAVVVAGNIKALNDRERQLADSETKFRLTADLAQDAFVLCDDQDRILFWNRAAEQMFGYPREIACGQEMHQLIINAEHTQGFAQGMEGFRRSGRGAVVGQIREVVARHRDGSLVPLEASVSAVQINGRWHAIGIMRNIAERKKAEAEMIEHRDHLAELVEARTQELRCAMERAEAANQAKTEFIANISHELRTPMHGILSLAELGEARAGKIETARIARYFEHIHSSGRRLLTLIDGLLDISKLEAGKLELVCQSLDLEQLAREVCEQNRPLFGPKHLRYSLEAAGDTTVWGDPAALGRVLLNLLSNAVKFSPDAGQIRIYLSPSSLPGVAGAAVSLQLADDGPGIPETEHEAVFDKFVQSSRTKTGAGGTGLGLAICKEIIVLHHGLIRALPSPAGGGALMEFIVPCLPLPERSAE